MNARVRRALLLSVAGASLGCGDEVSTLEPRTQVRVTPGSLALAVGDSAVVRAYSTDRSGGRLSVQRHTFDATRPAVAAVRVTSDTTAVVVAAGAGDAAVTVVNADFQTLTVPVTVHAR
ncbi:hypothetical protein [Roseisolibacter sp. H3M3-2]|uniref:hypothetical protein n=1 Tax=Roseisolibacter sp. H3M3-2 TaxID=3031323 RepID=UPI0023DB68C9|nr:hypothetical protein [Roseisolibacter sp. H3M3-2]MDF1504656.1 hypothetical protein [Roseisolibacter sp. H3M3-2]